MQKYVFLYDLDETIVDSRHRSQITDGLFDVDYWNLNSTQENINKDHLIFPMTSILLYTQTHPQCLNVCITSREIFPEDINFFKKHGIYFHDYLYRGSNFMFNHLHKKEILQDFELKDLLLSNYKLITKFKPAFGFDDKDCNLEVYKKFNFKTYNAKDINYNKINYREIKKEIDNFLEKEKERGNN